MKLGRLKWVIAIILTLVLTFSSFGVVIGKESSPADEAEVQITPWGVERIGANLVHPYYKGKGVKVAILSTGIDLHNRDLRVAGDVTFVTGTSNGDDDNGHGTKVASIVAALDNDIDSIGVAPEARLYAVKVLDKDGRGKCSNILSGIEWAIDNGMQVINMSFGSYLNMPSPIVRALDSAWNSGIVVVAAAGDAGTASGEGDNIWSPARYDSVIAVGAIDQSGVRPSYSSTGSTLELAAPGPSTGWAAPHIAGVAALLISSGVTDNTLIRQRLHQSAEDLGVAGWDSQYGYGLVNAEKAVLVPGSTPPQTMHISSIDMSLHKAGESEVVFARATVEVVDAAGKPVNGAKVSGHWEGATDDADKGGTDVRGRVTLQSDWLKSPSGGERFTFVVDDVTKNGWVYDSDANEETSDSVCVNQ